MKYLSIICIILGLQSLCKVTPKEELHLLDGLPPNFSYQLNSDSIAILNNHIDLPYITYSQEAMTIGCYNPIDIKPVFSIGIGHQFLFEEVKYFDTFIKKEKVSKFQLIFYGVKKEHNEKDSLLLNALAEYCIYGQTNYVFESEDYILFSYSFAMHVEGIIDHLRKLGFWNAMETHLKENLNKGATLTTKTQLPIPTDNPHHKETMIEGEFIWESGGMPARRIERENGEIQHITAVPSFSQTYLSLKKNHKSTWISNYDQVKVGQYKYKCSWFMDNHYIYVHHPQYKIETFRIHNENVLMHISEQYGFSRIQD